MILNFTTPPSRELYNHVKAGFVANGDTLAQWAKRNGIFPMNAVDAVLGRSNSPAAQKIRKKVIMTLTQYSRNQAS